MKAIYYYFERDFVKWLRGRVTVISSLVMPAAWLVFVGLALPTKFTDNYLQFITPGILVMTTLFSSLQGGSLMIFDKILGFLNKFLAMPSPRESMLYGKILFISVRGLLQATVILLIAAFLGVRILKPIHIVLIYLTLFMFSVFFSAVSTMIGLYLSDHDSYAAVNSMISMPLFFTSSALMPYEVMPAWLRTLAKLNPVSYAIDSVRMLFEGGIPVNGIIGLAIGAGIMVLLGTYQFRKAVV
ncbi:ABC-2 type transport system permease protein [Methanosarcina thermophila]|jgi:ABC-2 type transport system permease protein|uniref:ABC-2 type transport system permease protein n=3 Tax=Methanosarcina thermophila TaxID=2210 RepID=A0A1I7ARK2_METTE|nr:ABC transporter permease [Methanosarcina thermophila]ALK04397.1 MAG: multidrug ABC transporter permease [Methanosarcina sp. 795]AKB13016.1 ABC transporter, permease protein [Methanosarcina thermophila TM-1]AKB16353.1 ABC transporter, permease protein [Methanosarcina thermophila CHTI-55]SFT77589.1 ABC-2 type transport system permease protein [Methanosarcina thermophila]BAW28000.1 multidrug ABC transporter permease [Methanosarcina thermophila]